MNTSMSARLNAIVSVVRSFINECNKEFIRISFQLLTSTSSYYNYL